MLSVRAEIEVLILGRGTYVCASFAWMTEMLPSLPFELKISLRLGSNATASEPLPIGTLAMICPVWESTTVSNWFRQLTNSRCELASMASPWGLSHSGNGQRETTRLLAVSI